MISQEIEIPREVPVMTLSQTVLFPQAMMPLFIFEPRYREMLSTVLEGDRIFAVAALDERDEDAEVLETPYSIAGVGVVRACKQNPDGTSNLILQGLARVKFENFVCEEPYRRARIQQVNERVRRQRRNAGLDPTYSTGFSSNTNAPGR